MQSPDSSEFQRFWTGDRIDRSFAANDQRLMIGLHVASDWSRIDGCLAVGNGRGRYLRLRHAVDEAADLPEELAGQLRRIAGNGSKTCLGDEARLFPQRELAAVQAALVDQLAAAAGRYVDRILAIAVVDPGFWQADFDGAPAFQGATDGEQLAELTGLNVIDGFPARDVAAGGSGKFLQALPAWFMEADRRERQTAGHTLLLVESATVEWYFLPAADVLDEGVPEVRSGTLDVLTAANAQQQARQLLAGLPCDPQTGQRMSPTHCRVAGEVGWSQRLGSLISALQLPCPNEVPAESPIGPRQFSARAAAVLGLLFADQVPQNVPVLTGARGPRLLGRLVPGRPYSFSNLVASMADSQVSTMRLRNAV